MSRRKHREELTLEQIQQILVIAATTLAKGRVTVVSKTHRRVLGQPPVQEVDLTDRTVRVLRRVREVTNAGGVGWVLIEAARPIQELEVKSIGRRPKSHIRAVETLLSSGFREDLEQAIRTDEIPLSEVQATFANAGLGAPVGAAS